MTIDKAKAAPGFYVAAHGEEARMRETHDLDPKPTRPHRRFADRSMLFDSTEHAIEHSHEIYDARCRPKLVDFSERAHAWRNGTHARDEFFGSRSVAGLYANIETLAEFVGWCDAQILAAARGERTLP